MTTAETPKKSSPVREPVIKVEGISRWFGNVVSVSDVSFEIYPGITGLLGPNGAGKTTLLRMITGLAAPSEGSVTVFGENIRENPELYRRIGVMSEHEAVYDFLTGRDFVQFAAELRGVADPKSAATDAIENVGLSFAADRKMGGYSRGMKQRMRLAATIVHSPDLLILDEPLNGADPRQRVHFQNLLRGLAAQGRTIFISSHILEEVEALAERVLLIANGKLAASGDYRSIRAALNKRPYHVRIICSDPRAMASGLMRLEEVEAVNIDPDGALIAQSRNVLALQMALPALALESKVRLMRVEPLDDSLESVFSYLVGG